MEYLIINLSIIARKLRGCVIKRSVEVTTKRGRRPFGECFSALLKIGPTDGWVAAADR